MFTRRLRSRALRAAKEPGSRLTSIRAATISVPASYWQHRYSNATAVAHHARQNKAISRDFFAEAVRHPKFVKALSVKRIIEVGSGTGELCALIHERFNPDVLHGSDFSRAAVNVALKRHPWIVFWVYDVLMDEPMGRYDLCISSNVLEHFREPFTVLERMLDLASVVLLLVPYRQLVTDGYDGEGGAGHVAHFAKRSFRYYNIVDAFTFETKGWQHSSQGEKPRQLAVLLKRRLRHA